MKEKQNIDFNPVKEDTSGKQAKRAVWSTKVIDVAIKGLMQGKKLIANPFYENEIKLLKGDLLFQRTPEEIEEWKHCSEDILYFAEKYCKLLTPEGIKHVKLRGYQKKYLKHLENTQLSIYLACRQCGKCLDYTSSICIKLNNNWLNQFHDEHTKSTVDKLKKYWDSKYYIIEGDYYELPIFELMNIYKKSFKWKIKYNLYKILYKLDHGAKIKKRSKIS